MPIVNWGIHKGKDISDPSISTSYLEWCSLNFKGITLTVVQEELKRRSSGAIGTTTKLSRDEFAEKLMNLIMKMPEGLNEQTVRANGYEITIKKLF